MGIYTAISTGTVSAAGTSFDAAKDVTIALNTPHPTRVVGQPFVGHLGALYVDATVASGSPTKVTVRVGTADDGDSSIIVPDTEATFAVGVSTSSELSATYSIDIPYSDLSKTDTVYVLFKVDAGTINVAAGAVRLTWSD
tara:strand:- start:287 stop:706 length:420 start_codon:yes stop_codon:yes gene_type:complete